MEETAKARIPLDKLVIGVFLVGVGLLSFLGAIDVLRIRDIWRFWPMILILFGLLSEIEAFRKRKSDGGFILLAIGVWMLAGSLELFGLSYGGAMPIGVVVVGLGLVLHAIVDRRSPVTREEKDNVC